MADDLVVLDVRSDLDAPAMDQQVTDLATRFAVPEPVIRGMLAMVRQQCDLVGLAHACQQAILHRPNQWHTCTRCGADHQRGASRHFAIEPNKRAWVDKRMEMTGCCLSCALEQWNWPSQVRSVALIQPALQRARRAGRPHTLYLERWSDILDAFNDRCAICGAPWSDVMHLVPVELGGGTTGDNCVPACTICLTKKGKRLIEEMLGAEAVAKIRQVLDA